MLDAGSPLPLYHQLAEELFGQIRAGVYAPGDKIPSEHTLSAAHGIGRPTVRQATDSLIQRGVLVRKRGSGTFVRSVPAQVDLFSLAGTLASFEARGVALTAELLHRPLVLTVDEADHPLHGQSVVRVERLSRVAREPVLLERIDFDAERFAGLSRMSLKARSLSDVVQEQYGMRPSCADQVFRVEVPGKDEARTLALATKQAVLRVDRTLHFPLAERAIHARMLCRTDRFQFSQRIGGHSHA